MQNTSLNGYDLVEQKVLTGLINTTATAPEQTYRGFTEIESTTISGTIIADGSLVLNRYYNRNIYKVTLVTNGGTIFHEDDNITQYIYGVGEYISEGIELLGHEFGGWFTNNEFTGTPVTQIGTTEIGDKTFYAKWIINKYEVVFKNEGNIIDTQIINYGQTAIPPILTKPGYTLEWDRELTNITSNMEVNAIWTANEDTPFIVEYYKQNISLNGYDKVETEQQTGVTDQTVIAQTKQYEGFKVNTQIEGTVSSGIVKGDGSLLLKLYYDRNTYQVILSAGDGTINSGEITKYVYGIGAILPQDVTRAGYRFGGWYSDYNCSGTQVTSITPTDIGAKIYYAKWDTNSYTVTFKNGKEIVKTENVEYGQAATAPVITKEGYTLSWDKEFSHVTQDLEVNAVWLENSTVYRVEHYTQNTQLKGYDLEYTEVLGGATNQMITARAKQYQGFTENVTTLDRVPDGIIREDGSLVLKLYYDRNNYHVVLNTNNGMINDGNVTSYIYGIGAELPTNVTRSGYLFGGWYENSTYLGIPKTQISTTEIGDKTYYAKWNIGSYTVVFKDNGKIVKTQNVNYGGSAEEPNLTKPGYTLNWDIPFNNVTSDLEVNAIWTANTNTEYKIEHYQQDTTLKGYTLKDTEILTGTTDTEAIASAKAYRGFTENKEQVDRITTGIIAGDGSLTLKLYYDRNSYNVILNTNGGIINSGNITSYTYGIEKMLPQNITQTGKEFKGWYEDSIFSGEKVEKISATEIGNKAYYAKWSEDQDAQTPYKIEHYKQNTDYNGYYLAETENLKGATGTIIIARAKTYSGYVENIETTQRIPSGIVAEDGSLVMKLYYDIKNINEVELEVIFKSDGNIIDTQKVKYGKGASAPHLEKTGYTLSWDKDFSRVTQNMIVNAVWTKNQETGEYYIRSDKYMIDEQYISRVSPSTNKTEFINHIETNGTITKITNAIGNNINSEELVTTGSTLYVEYNGRTYTYVIIVRGDLDKNGKLTITDVSMLNQSLTGGITLDSLQEKAADLDYNNRITITDLSMINQAIVGAIEL